MIRNEQKRKKHMGRSCNTPNNLLTCMHNAGEVLQRINIKNIKNTMKTVTETIKEIALLIKAKDYMKRSGLSEQIVKDVSAILSEKQEENEEFLKALQRGN